MRRLKDLFVSLCIGVAILAILEAVLRQCSSAGNLTAQAPSWMDEDTYRLWRNWAEANGMGVNQIVSMDTWTWDPVLRWRLKPDIEVVERNFFLQRNLGPDAYWLLLTDHEGFRNRKSFGRKHAAGTRIAAIGDSNTMGWLLDQERTLPARLEQRLNTESAGSFEVVNLGVAGYTSFSLYQVLKENIDRLAPDIVLISCGANDPQRLSVSDADYAKNNAAGPARLKFLLSRLALTGTVNRLLGRAAKHSVPRVSARDFGGNLERIFNRVLRSGATPVFVKICCCLDEYEAELERVTSTRGVQVVESAGIRDWALSNGLQAVLAQARAKAVQWYGRNRVEADPYLDLYFPDKCHLNRFGADILARMLADLLSSMLGVGPS